MGKGVNRSIAFYVFSIGSCQYAGHDTLEVITALGRASLWQEAVMMLQD